MSREIVSSNGHVITVDDSDFESLNSHSWSVRKAGHSRYANTYLPGVGHVHMHRVIMNCKTGDGVEVDHINRNGLDNRRCNLRLANKKTNARNSIKRPKVTSRFKGVSWFSLTDMQVLEIRRRHDGCYGIGKTLASEFGVTQATISAIKANRIWKHLSDKREVRAEV